jgi:hypothetical protein
METNARSLVEHWTWAADKGLMNGNTAAGLRSACSQILQVIGDGWETTDITTVDVDDLLLRFQNLKKKDYTPQVLELYKKRFRKATASYLSYLENPGSWKPSTQERPTTSRRNDRPEKRQPTTEQVASSEARYRESSNEVEYRFPLRAGVMARIVLPRDLTRDDVNRLSAFMSMLVVSADDGCGTPEEGSHERRNS